MSRPYPVSLLRVRYCRSSQPSRPSGRKEIPLDVPTVPARKLSHIKLLVSFEKENDAHWHFYKLAPFGVLTVSGYMKGEFLDNFFERKIKEFHNHFKMFFARSKKKFDFVPS